MQKTPFQAAVKNVENERNNKILGWRRQALSKNNHCFGCFYLQALWNILASKESVSNRSEPGCLSQIIRKNL